jgi:hypothetical protein
MGLVMTDGVHRTSYGAMLRLGCLNSCDTSPHWPAAMHDREIIEAARLGYAI